MQSANTTQEKQTAPGGAKIILFPSSPNPGSPEWRRVKGLMTIGDLIRDYGAIRRPCGDYYTPMVNDIVRRDDE